ncbi:glutathione S-transferase [Mariprofundus erugo]|uniref:Glutathione S-transferase n=1 Tax=Mariprofundus erugo TaxID=2528639 RepID=A0A5R9GPE1_9PROT|nr:glutathione S-transferase [Mariprofundus erugo]TLS67498.1 glutathione S-transferase [Mariprofundus erugo]
MTCPVLYSFRRCPYAIRARLALSYAAVQCELREVVLKAKPEALIGVSPKATVPVLTLCGGRVIDESLDIMLWALEQSDPESWLKPESGTWDEMLTLIALNDSEFKHHLDRYKYPERFVPALEQQKRPPEELRAGHLKQAMVFLARLDQQLQDSIYLFGDDISLADAALFPFVRQFAAVDTGYFGHLPLRHLQRWHSQWMQDPLFINVMTKFQPWQPGNTAVFL